MANGEYAVKLTEAGENLARELAHWEHQKAKSDVMRTLVDDAVRNLDDWAEHPYTHPGIAWACDWWGEVHTLGGESQIAVKCAVVARVGYLPPMGLGGNG